MTNLTKNLEFWMTNLPQQLRSVPVVHLAIPGSHDSTTFALTQKSTISPDSKTIIRYLKFLEPVLNPFMVKWSRTQHVDIVDQLNSGIRYFDLRIATKVHSHKFFFVHNLYSECIDVVLQQIKDFLDNHPKEIVILDCQHFFNLTANDHQRLISLLISTFGPKLQPYTPTMTELTLDYMTSECQCQVVLIYRADEAIVEESFWPSVSVPTPWPNTVSISELISFVSQGVKNRNYSLGFVSQCVLTPTLWFAVKHLFSSLESKCALPLEKQKYEWLKQQKPGRGGLNIVISDFVEYQDYQFPREVINLNRKLLENASSDD